MVLSVGDRFWLLLRFNSLHLADLIFKILKFVIIKVSMNFLIS